MASVRRTLAAYCRMHGRIALAREFAGVAGSAILLCKAAAIFVALEPLR